MNKRNSVIVSYLNLPKKHKTPSWATRPMSLRSLL